MSDLPVVSAIIPCHNEEKYIDICLDSIISNNYPKDKLQVIVVDGASEDSSFNIISKYTLKCDFIKIISNTRKTTPISMNLGIKNSSGTVIMKMDAHSKYDSNYIHSCIKYMYEYDADNVGGSLTILPGNDSTVAKSIALSLSSKFGAGNSYVKTGSVEARWVDTVAYGCYKREVFDKIGLYNENLTRGQDMDINRRLINAGGKILLHPDIKCNYYAISDLGDFWKHNFSDGFWAIYPLRFGCVAFRLRHLIPMFFLISIIISLLFLLWLPLVFFCIILSYLLLTIYFSIVASWRAKAFNCLHLLPIVFWTRHVAYGLGSIKAVFNLAVSKEFWKNIWEIGKGR